MRYYQLTATECGPLPEHQSLEVGAIIRVPRSNSPKPGAQWNPEMCCWVRPIWTEVADPRTAAAS